MCALFLDESTQFIKWVKVLFSTDFRIACNVGRQMVDFGSEEVNKDLPASLFRLNSVQVLVEGFDGVGLSQPRWRSASLDNKVDGFDFRTTELTQEVRKRRSGASRLFCVGGNGFHAVDDHLERGCGRFR